jgi:DNA primase
MLLRISRERIEAIKAQVDLPAIIAERGIQFQRKGRHLFALCPFHQERTASFVVTPHRGLFHCFGCGVGGDAIGFLVRYDRVSFPEAVRILAARAGVGVEQDSRRPALRRTDRELEELRHLTAARGEDMCGRTS